MKLILDYITALTQLYGIVDESKMLEIYNQQNKESITADQIHTIMKNETEQLKKRFVYVQNNYFVHETILEFDEFDLQMRKKHGKPYYVPSKTELLKYTDQFYFEKNKQYLALQRYITKHFFGGDRIQADHFCEDIQGLLQVEAPISQVLNEFNHKDIVFDNDEQVEEVVSLITDLSNNTRIWANNGFTANEMFEYEKPFLNPLPEGNNVKEGDLNLAAVHNKPVKKVGRNESCPCGSGKKYKKCCLNKE